MKGYHHEINDLYDFDRSEEKKRKRKKKRSTITLGLEAFYVNFVGARNAYQHQKVHFVDIF